MLRRRAPTHDDPDNSSYPSTITPLRRVPISIHTVHDPVLAKRPGSCSREKHLAKETLPLFNVTEALYPPFVNSLGALDGCLAQRSGQGQASIFFSLLPTPSRANARTLRHRSLPHALRCIGVTTKSSWPAECLGSLRKRRVASR